MFSFRWSSSIATCLSLRVQLQTCLARQVAEMSESVVAAIKSAFGFLERDFGFAVSSSSEDAGKPFLGGSVRYVSSFAEVSVIVERMQIPLPPQIARVKDLAEFKRDFRISLDRIREYRLIPSQTRMRLASRDPEELKEGWKEVVKASLVGMPAIPPVESQPDTDSRIAARLDADAHLLRKYGEPYLRGDFSDWLGLCEYDWYHLIAGEIAQNRRWGEELTIENVERRFSRFRTYLEHLRREAGRT